MSDTPWTPGPWTHDEGSKFVRGPDRLPLHIAMTEPDARLIAAAPEMAELLAELAAPSFIGHTCEDTECPWFKARALLACIRGEADA